MSRFRLPARVAPSPAAEEPGLQNSAARLRSSREVQSRILAERRAPEKGGTDESVGTQLSSMPTVHFAEPEFAGKREGERHQPQSSASPAEFAGSGLAKPRKEKLVVLFRLPLATEKQLEQIPGAGDVTPAYMLRAFAKEARAELRRLLAEDDLAPHVDEARRIFDMAANDMAVGEAMTVYAQGSAIRAMHAALGDPWQIEPRATIVGAFLAAIASRLIEARRVR
ncbi:hypothetical protein LX70_03350 [Defluviimonas denitrificans]|jgi:hypothetical protein|uniref:Uncharacterized protein n=1 Tax=Albidovulum denitrificans TaxID=404881 RepID=A0A2S8S3K8_9RHOB|nr:hypothetical protein [Defluviimonas denitrificans]PQV55389.1 hypothetical protein LX70_03350 [Defluviimonas denitrificans]